VSANPLVSIIIATRNRVDRLRQVIDAALDDPYPELEICVADGASTDGTVELLGSYGPRVRFISEADGGEFIARNRALALARGTLIRNLSDDDVPVPGSVNAAVEFLDDHPEVDLLFGQSVSFYVHRDGSITLYDALPRTRRSIERRNFVFGYAPKVISETAVFRRNMIDRIGGFEQIRPGDAELWLRALSRGCGVAVDKAVFVHHFRFEAGETQLYASYRELLNATVNLADRYCSPLDRLYARRIWLPYRRLRHDVAHALPPQAASVVRRMLWALRRKGAVPPPIQPVRTLR